MDLRNLLPTMVTGPWITTNMETMCVHKGPSSYDDSEHL